MDPRRPGSQRSRPRIHCLLSLNRIWGRCALGRGPRTLPLGRWLLLGSQGASGLETGRWETVEVGDSGGESPSLEPAKVGSPSSRSSQGQCLLCKAIVKIRDKAWGDTSAQYTLSRC